MSLVIYLQCPSYKRLLDQLQSRAYERIVLRFYAVREEFSKLRVSRLPHSHLQLHHFHFHRHYHHHKQSFLLGKGSRQGFNPSLNCQLYCTQLDQYLLQSRPLTESIKHSLSQGVFLSHCIWRHSTTFYPHSLRLLYFLLHLLLQLL